MMASPTAINIIPMNPPNKDLEAMPLADKDYLIQDLVGDRNHLQTFCQLRNSFLGNCDMYGIWESNFPLYFLPSINIFSEIIRLRAENYEPTHSVVKSPSGSILFHITPDSINQMLNFKQTQLLFPFSMNYFGMKVPSSPALRLQELPRHS